MKTQLVICNDSDYLRAHLTIIAGKTVPGNPVLQHLKLRVASVLKRWIARRLPGLSRG